MKTGWLTAVVALSAALMTLDMTVVTIALPEISTTFSTGLEDAQWIVNGYVLVFAALLLGVGALSDHIPRRPLFITGHIIFGLASLLCALSPSAIWLITGRVIQAVGATLVFATCMPLIADAHEGDETGRSRAVGIFMAAGAAAAALGPLIGGLIVGSGGWRWIFAINLPVSLIAIAVLVLVVPSMTTTNDQRAHIDWVSTALVAVGLFALNYALVEGPTKGWGQVLVLIAIILAIALLLMFGLLQALHGRDALLDLKLFAVPSFSAAIVLSFTARLVTFGLLPYLIFWLSGMQQRSPIQVGLILLALALPMVFIAAPSSALERTGKINLVTGIAMIVTAVGLAWLGIVMDADTHWAAVIGPLLVIGIGTGLAMPHMMNLALAVVPSQRSGSATGTVNTAFPLGTATGVAIFGAMLSAKIDTLVWAPQPVREAAATGQLNALQQILPDDAVTQVARTFTSGLSAIFFTGAAVSVLCGVICFIAIRNKDRWQDPA